MMVQVSQLRTLYILNKFVCKLYYFSKQNIIVIEILYLVYNNYTINSMFKNALTYNIILNNLSMFN